MSARLAAEDGLIVQAETTLKDVSAASVAFEGASRDLQSFSKSADLRVTRFGDEMSTLIADIGEVAESAKETVDESKGAVKSARDIIEEMRQVSIDARSVGGKIRG